MHIVNTNEIETPDLDPEPSEGPIHSFIQKIPGQESTMKLDELLGQNRHSMGTVELEGQEKHGLTRTRHNLQ